jgi:hypothetical protein
MTDRALSVLVHGHAKVGKTTFANTAPYPRLLLDVEAASRFLQCEKVYWDPMSEAPPVADGSWDTCIVRVTDFTTALKAYEWLKSGKHPFKSVILDSISELQVKAQELVAGRNQMKTQDWGTLLSKMAFFARDLRDLTVQKNPLEAVVVTAMSREVEGVLKPYLQGQIASQVAYWFDVTSYIFLDQVQDEQGNWVVVRKLLTDKNPQFEAGNRVPGLPIIIENPSIVGMLDTVFPQAPAVAPAAVPAAAAFEAIAATQVQTVDSSTPPAPPAE